MYVANVLRQISNSNGLWTGSHIPSMDKKKLIITIFVVLFSRWK